LSTLKTAASLLLTSEVVVLNVNVNGIQTVIFSDCEQQPSKASSYAAYITPRITDNGTGHDTITHRPMFVRETNLIPFNFINMCVCTII